MEPGSTGLQVPDGDISRLTSPPIWAPDLKSFVCLPPLSHPEDVISSDVNPPPTIAQLRRELFEDVAADVKAAAMREAFLQDKLRGDLSDQHGEQIQLCKFTDNPRDASPMVLHWIARTIQFDGIHENDARLQAVEFLAEIATEMDPSMLSTWARPRKRMDPDPPVSRQCRAP
jgi:hypothetical protein